MLKGSNDGLMQVVPVRAKCVHGIIMEQNSDIP